MYDPYTALMVLRAESMTDAERRAAAEQAGRIAAAVLGLCRRMTRRVTRTVLQPARYTGSMSRDGGRWQWSGRERVGWAPYTSRRSNGH
jgi:hypothetical protein